MSSQSSLQEVKRALLRLRRAEAEYLEALEFARSDKLTYGEIALVVGVSRQAVRQYVERRRKAT